MNVPLVCDYGSGFSKVGFSGMEAPRAVFPTILGKLRHDNLLVGMEEEDWFIGDEAQKRRRELNLQCPVSRATVTNWDNMEKIWHHSFYQVLCIAPEQHPLMVTEPPSNPMSSKEKMSQILFETFNVPALHLANQGVLSLYASGQTSGTTIESGEGMTYFVPIIDGCPLHQSTIQMDIAGQDLTLYLLQLLTDSGHSLVSRGDWEYIRDIKEKCCYVASDFKKEKMKASSPSYARKFQLPDGQEITLGPEKFLCPEGLFQADLMGRNSLGIHMKAFRSVSSCSPALWKILFGHMVLSGGTGCCPGLRFRLQREIAALVSPTINVKVSSCPSSIHSAWLGGSILSSLSTFKDMWVTNKEYKDIGASIVRRRAF
ncbi:actin-85C-like isoform X1 [Mustela putorius furo]|nr:actin-85C-like isoform X1 [Mustela putorius furo]XP_004759685.1 actin-85C-like isoform X1 [Mustela putorius furo]